MNELPPDLVRLIYGLILLIMGLAVVMRVFAYPTSDLRNRVLALGAFALLHGAATLFIVANFTEGVVPIYLRAAIHAPSYLMLYYFAFGWSARWPHLAHAVVLATVCGLAVISILDIDFGLVRLGVAVPASISAGLALVFDRSFRFGSRISEAARWIAATGFLACAVLFSFLAPADFFPASAFNDAEFEAVTGVSIHLARGGAFLAIMIGTLALLNTFDASRRRKGERELSISENWRKTAMRIGKMGAWELHLVTNQGRASANFCRILGLSPNERRLSLAGFLERVHPDDRDIVEKAVERALRSHTPYEIGHRIMTPEGGVRFLQGHGEVEIGSDGNPQSMLCVFQDITEFKNAKEAVHEKDAKLSRILEVSPEAIIVADEQARIVLFNKGAERTFGYSSAETIGRSVEMLMPDCFRAAHQAHVRAFTAAPERSRMMGQRNEITGLRKNGEEFPAEASISKLRTSDGLTYTVSLRDVTGSKALREELIEAKVAAESASAAKSNFIANMSHELRTPLNAILGFSETMSSGIYGPLGSPKYREYAEDIHKSGRHLLDIINDILSLSELDAEKKMLSNPGPVEIQELLDDCVKWTKKRASKAGVEIQVDVSHDVPPLWGDKRLLTQVFLNLLTNAVKFTPDGGTVAISAKEGGSGRVRISVRDTGIGMTPDQVTRVGEPFLQFDHSASRKFNGTGLGLSITKRLVELHGGVLEVESEFGVGSTFSIEMPGDSAVRPTARKTMAG